MFLIRNHDPTKLVFYLFSIYAVIFFFEKFSPAFEYNCADGVELAVFQRNFLPSRKEFKIKSGVIAIILMNQNLTTRLQ